MILTTIEQFKVVFPSVDSTIDFNQITTFRDTAENYLKEDLLGDDLYDFVDVEAAKETTTHTILIEKCRTIICLQALHEAIPFWDVILTGNGFGIVNTNQIVPASAERVKQLREATIARRDAVIDYLIDYLEATVDYHDEWKGSPIYEELSNCLFRTARELKRFSTWNGSRSEFLALKPKLVKDTMLVIEPMVSADYIAELIEKQRDNDVEATDKKVLDLCKWALGSMAIDNKPAAELLIGQLITFMDKNETDYPTYLASDEYATRHTAGYENEQDSSIFVSNG